MNTLLLTNHKFGRMFVNILSIFVIVTIAFPAMRIVAAQAPAPYIRISTSNNYLRADNFTPNATVTFTVYATQDPGEDPLWSDSRIADMNGFAIIWPSEQPLDLVIGNFVVVTDGTNEKQIVLEPLTIDLFDSNIDLVAGTAPPERWVWVVVGNDTIGYPANLSVQTNENGQWTADFEPVYDFTEDMWGSAELYDGDGDATVYHKGSNPPPPNPWARAHPEWESVDGWFWPLGAELHLAIDDPNTLTSPDLEMTQIVDVVSDPPQNNSVWFEFAGVYDLKPGDVVTMTDGTTTQDLVVSNVSITAVDMINDTVSGRAEPGAVVRLPIPAELFATANDGGKWYADFAAAALDLVPGMVIAEVYDEDGDLTSFERDAFALGWQQMNVSGFGDPSTTGVTALEIFHSQIYAGASNWNSGGQVWRLAEDGQWLQVSDSGFGSGASLPAVVDLTVFKGQLYAGMGWSDVSGQVWRSPNGTNWEPVTTDGFGDGGNGVISNFAVFEGMLYAGTGNSTGSAQIWRSKTGDSGDWTQVAPDGDDFNGNVTGFAVYNDILFTAIESASGAPVQVWRSTDGRDWTIVTADGFGDPNNISTGGLAEFDGYLYLGIRNDATGGQIWRTADGVSWEPVVDNGFGDINNIKIESLQVYKNILYAVTYNGTGIQVWLSADGASWEQISANGFGDSGNFSTLWSNATTFYRGHLLLGTWNGVEGGELWMFTP